MAAADARAAAQHPSRHVALLGERHENPGAWDRAIELYHRSIEIDGLAEDLYRRLMPCHIQRGDQAGALNGYRRRREALSILLRVAPAPSDASAARSNPARS